MPPKLDENSAEGAQSAVEADGGEEEDIPESGIGRPTVTKKNRKTPGNVHMPLQYAGVLPDIIPNHINCANWRNDQLDAFFEIPTDDRTNKATRLKWIKNFRTWNVNMGQVHDQAMIVASQVGKAVLATAREEIQSVKKLVGEEFTHMNALEEKVEILEKGQRIDRSVAKEILIYHEGFFKELEDTEKQHDKARERVFNLVKPLYSFWKDWRDIRKVRKIGSGDRARVVAEVVSNHVRERIICTWNDEGQTLIKDYPGLQIAPAKTAYDQNVGSKMYQTYVECDKLNSSSKGDVFYVVEKPPKEKFKRPVAYSKGHPKVASQYEAWQKLQADKPKKEAKAKKPPH